MDCRALPVTLGTTGDGTRFLASPNREQPRWLLPMQVAKRRMAMALYEPQKLRGKVLKQLLSVGFPLGDAVIVPEAATLTKLLARLLDTDVQIAMSIGTAGPFQKLTVLVSSPTNGVVAFAKVANGTRAARSLENEQRILEQIEAEADLRDHVPRAIALEAWNDTVVLVTTPGPFERGSGNFGAAHDTFLRRVEAVWGARLPFGESPMWATMRAHHHEVAGSVGEAWSSRYERALQTLDREMATQSVNVTLAHRDFTPWNVRVDPAGGLYVFDWEFAHEGYLSSYDRTHFWFMQRVLLGRDDAFPHSDGVGDARLEYLAYLTDLSLFHHWADIAGEAAHAEAMLRTAAAEIDRLHDFL